MYKLRGRGTVRRRGGVVARWRLRGQPVPAVRCGPLVSAILRLLLKQRSRGDILNGISLFERHRLPTAVPAVINWRHLATLTTCIAAQHAVLICHHALPTPAFLPAQPIPFKAAVLMSGAAQSLVSRRLLSSYLPALHVPSRRASILYPLLPLYLFLLALLHLKLSSVLAWYPFHIPLPHPFVCGVGRPGVDDGGETGATVT